MLYYQNPSKNFTRLSRGSAKLLAYGSILAYVGGCIWLLNVPTEGFKLFDIMGYVLIFGGLLASGVLVNSSWQRIGADEKSRLDEREVMLQSQANEFAFKGLSVIVLVAIAYCGVATDQGIWTPSKYEHFNALFWGVFLLCALLPTIYVLNTSDHLEDEE